ncbi:hypothetical protein Ec2_00160 [Escherichia phage JES2013]|uniref:Uncharacterized protein n=1 Tax=Escherichia phage JES2013 TaxID=1327956 RepID=S4UT94_9CAUD|nr:hypothetical protein P766_gp160 [Escherichia phage JES2013]AGM12549.1 hypothetical protein Ec2_00160 [Escherichia phage JES2013]
MRKIIITLGIVVAILALFPLMVRYVLIGIVLAVSDLLETVGTLF